VGSALSYLPLSSDITDALLGKPRPLYDMLQLVKFYENADWEKVSQYAAKLGPDESVIPDAYIEAAEWVSDFAVVA
jgi:c-di-GMP-related signal transduction protein